MLEIGVDRIADRVVSCDPSFSASKKKPEQLFPNKEWPLRFYIG
ncbi:hypothetical protein ACTVDP_15535 [Anoxybacteroides rupiense]|nr:hypothetical protein [Anoxybacillus sp. P3H1B]